MTVRARVSALEGVLSQPSVGFLTLLERLSYCTVGWNLKHPQHPVWLLASETHITGEHRLLIHISQVSTSLRDKSRK